MKFSYAEMIKRNYGFINMDEQEILRKTPVFVCGVGGMGGACLLSLVRAGMENITIADIDAFEVSNINRQVFASMRTEGMDKAEATIMQIKEINPEARIKNQGPEWLSNIDEILKTNKVVINGSDDIISSVALYRKAREHGATVIDAYTSPLPSVYVTTPLDQTPEERLNFGTRSIKNISSQSVSSEVIDQCKLEEIVYVLTNSSSIQHIDVTAAIEMMSGQRSRMSLSTMVITTGNLMAFQVIATALKKKSKTDERGYFFDAYAGKCEHPRIFPIRLIKEILVRAFLKKLLK